MKNLSSQTNENAARFMAIADRLAHEVSSLAYGACSVELTVHDGRVVSTTYAVTEKTRCNERG